jgi:hypothetical protein
MRNRLLFYRIVLDVRWVGGIEISTASAMDWDICRRCKQTSCSCRRRPWHARHGAFWVWWRQGFQGRFQGLAVDWWTLMPPNPPPFKGEQPQDILLDSRLHELLRMYW